MTKERRHPNTGPGDWLRRKKRGLTRLRPHWVQGRVSHFRLETGHKKAFAFLCCLNPVSKPLDFAPGLLVHGHCRGVERQMRAAPDQAGPQFGGSDTGPEIEAESSKTPTRRIRGWEISGLAQGDRGSGITPSVARSLGKPVTTQRGHLRRRGRGRTRKERAHRSAHLEIPKFGAFPLSQIFEFQARPPRSSLFSANFLTSPPSASVRGSCYSAVRIYVVRSVGEKADIREG